MSDKLTEIAARWAAARPEDVQLRVTPTFLRPGERDCVETARAYEAAPRDVAWLIAELHRREKAVRDLARDVFLIEWEDRLTFEQVIAAIDDASAELREAARQR
jgi:hypothetical protein